MPLLPAGLPRAGAALPGRRGSGIGGRGSTVAAARATVSRAPRPRRACGRSLIERIRALSPVVRQSSSVAASAISSHWGVLVDADCKTVNLKLGYGLEREIAVRWDEL
jgi:hypothetical protein